MLRPAWLRRPNSIDPWKFERSTEKSRTKFVGKCRPAKVSASAYQRRTIRSLLQRTARLEHDRKAFDATAYHRYCKSGGFDLAPTSKKERRRTTGHPNSPVRHSAAGARMASCVASATAERSAKDRISHRWESGRALPCTPFHLPLVCSYPLSVPMCPDGGLCRLSLER
jgi:hypothetical protein